MRSTLQQTLLLPLLCAAACSEPDTGSNNEDTIPYYPPYLSEAAKHVNPLVGTAKDGNTFPGAVAPWGMVSVSPHNSYSTPLSYSTGEGLAPSGYVHGKKKILGFGLTHLSGVGCPDLGAPVIAAVTGPMRTSHEQYGSSHGDEVAWPGYYAVELLDFGVTVEATATPRVGLLRLRFDKTKGKAGHVLFDAGQNVSWMRGSGAVRVVSSSEVEGSSTTGFFCAKPNKQTVYFVARLNRPADATGTWKDDKQSTAAARSGDVGAFFTYRAPAETPLEVHVGISYVSVANARDNLRQELSGGRGFLSARLSTFKAWEAALSRVRVSGGSADYRATFYTALYHTLLHPNVISDVNGQYPRAGGKTGTIAKGQEHYSVFSLWDSYRTVHPLLTLLYPERQLAMLRSMARLAADFKRPPKWELAGSEVNMMVGDPAAVVVADSYQKGLTDFDVKGLYAVMREAALDTTADPLHRPGNVSYRALGYVPMEQAKQVWGPVSTTLEYAFSDWALSRLAARLGHAADAKLFAAQAAAHHKLLDAKTGLLRPKNKDGSWYSPFDPDAITGSRPYKNAGGPGYVEGTAWHYAFFVPHDVAGLAKAHGGDAVFVKRLQALFDDNRFVMWNEPDIAYPYLFTYFPGEAWRTQREVRKIMSRFYSNAPAGLPGNDDAGALSAWYVMSAMGFYTDCPGSLRYSLGSPLFDRVELALQPGFHQGKSFVIEAPQTSAALPHVSAMTLNGKPHIKPYLTHQQIVAGGALRLTMSASKPK